MHQHDVLIVGGGPAGSTLAWALRQYGLDVAILDKQSFPRDKVCAGWITPAVIESLKIDTQAYQEKNILQPIFGFRVGCLSGDMTEIEYPKGPVSYAIRRYEFDNYLLKRSAATIYENVKLESMNYKNYRWLLNDKFTAPLVIGAGGHFCPVARHIGAKLGKHEVAISAKEVEFMMTEHQQQACKVLSDRPELYFCDDLKGYGWVVRKQNYLNIGLGREDNNRLNEHVTSFCESLKHQGRIPDNIPDNFRGHAYLCYPQASRSLVDDGVLLIGDAAGLAYPESGEGIRPAIESALIAAEVIEACAGDYSKDTLARYKKRLERRFGKRAMPHAVMDHPLIDSFKLSLAKKLLTKHWFNKQIVLNRWFLHQQQKSLLIDSRVT